MIHLDPPYRMIDGYTVLRDHADPQLHYVLPAAPTLATGADGVPEFTLLQYQGGGPGDERIEGGILTLTTELHVADEVLTSLAERLRREDTSGGAVRLVPVLFSGGSVELIALGQRSTSATTPDDGPAEAPFDVTILGSGRPSLGGRNRATFQLVLDSTAAQLVGGAVEAPDMPIVVIYRMSFSGLRPSFQIDIQADWRQIYDELGHKVKANAYYVAADVETMARDVLEESNVDIDTTVFGAGSEAGASAERARKQLIDWILGRLFEPLVDPEGAANAVGRVIDDTIFSLTRSVLPGVSYRLRKLSDDQVRLLSARMNETVAESREVVPQGTIGGLIHRYRTDEDGEPRADWPQRRRRLVQPTPINGLLRLEVEVSTENRYESDGVREIQVELARTLANGALVAHQTCDFRTAAESQWYLVNLLGSEPLDFARPYQYRMVIQFDPASPFGPHDSVVSPWQVGKAGRLVVEPRGKAYHIQEVRIGVAPTFSFAQFPKVSVELRSSNEGAAAGQTDRIVLTEESQEQTWTYRGFADELRPFEYHLTYHRPPGGGGALVIPNWTPHLDDWLSISDPMPRKVTLNVFVNLPWQEIAIAYLQFRYEDGTNGVRYDEQVDLSASTRHLRKVYAIADDGPGAMDYRLTALLASGPLMEGSWRTTEDNRLVIDRRQIDNRLIRIHLLGGNLDENRLSEVRIGVRAIDPDTGQTRAETEIRITSANEAQSQTWEYLLGDPSVREIECDGKFIHRDGFVDRVGPTRSTAERLLVHLPTRSIRT